MKARSKGAGKVKPGIPGLQVMDEAVAKGHGFKKGGKVVGKDCPPADGGMSKPRADRPARKASGGAVTMQGRSPYSAASSVRSPGGIKENG